MRYSERSSSKFTYRLYPEDESKYGGDVDISNSEIEDFLRCRRMWKYGSSNKLGLRTINPSPNTALHVGAVVHKVLEAQVSLKRRPNIQALIDASEEELENYYRELVGVGWSPSERDVVRSSRDLISGICNHYFTHYGDVNPLGPDYEYRHAEITFSVPIPGTEHNLRGTIDGIAEGEDGVYLVEHKTTSQGFPEATELQIGRQLQAYVWAAKTLLGHPVQGIIYDGIAKKVPAVPEVTKKGMLSKAPITTTPEIYRAAIRAVGHDEADYQDILTKLSGQSPFFCRHVIRFPERALELFSLQLRQIVTDMANPDLPLYPNRVWQGCWDCRYTELCTAEQLGEDTEAMMRMKYRHEERAPTRRNVAITELEL